MMKSSGSNASIPGAEVYPVLATVRAVLSRQFGIGEDEISPGDSIFDDLGADSLDRIDLVLALEEAFGIEIDRDAEAEVETVADLCHRITLLV